MLYKDTLSLLKLSYHLRKASGPWEVADDLGAIVLKIIENNPSN